MTNCVNKNSKEFIKLYIDSNINPEILASKIAVWQNKNGLDKFPTLKDLGINNNTISYNLKAVEILSSDKAIQVFEKGKKNNWNLNKILTELQIPKQQKQIILDKIDVINNTTRIGTNYNLREEIITSLLADNSFVVEVNTSTQSKGNLNTGLWRNGKTFDFNGDTYEVKEINYTPKYFKNGDEISFDEIVQAEEDLLKTTEGLENTSYYSNLTVPGGTNYTENEIATPDITPNIKGHAQFSTDNGIGWFRSDDKTKETQFITETLKDGSVKMIDRGITPTKTRRILELQSDLFQKGRNKKVLAVNKNTKASIDLAEEAGIDTSQYTPILEGAEKENNFLQLLNQKNNWVTFFVKSIIQDSVKKDYEKVLFPKGDTAAKIEGHQTLEEFKRQKEDRIKELEENLIVVEGGVSGGKKYWSIVFEKSKVEIGNDFSKESAENRLKDLKEKNKNEINQLKQELADVESGKTQLSSIANFYENQVTNILKKNYDVIEITDEYGNKWNEVNLQGIDTNIQLSKGEQIRQKASNNIEHGFESFYSKLDFFEKPDKYLDYLNKNNNPGEESIITTEDKIKRMQEAFDAVVLVDSSLEVSGKILSSSSPISKNNGGKPVILINPDKLFGDTVFHEFGHLYIDLLGGMSDPLVQDAIEMLKGTSLWNKVEDNYPELNSENLAKEVLATALGIEGDILYKNNPTKRSIWNRIKATILEILGKLFKKNPSAIEKLASEMLNNKTRLTGSEKFNSIIDQNSKLRIDNPNQQNIDKLFKHFKENYILDESENREYKEKNSGESFPVSVSSIAKSFSKTYFSSHKGDFDLPFEKGFELTKLNYTTILNSKIIPKSLDITLGKFFSGDIGDGHINIKREDQYWYDFYVEMLNKEDALQDINSLIKDNIDIINKEAYETQKELDKPLQAGNMVHKALEDYINEGIPFPENIIDQKDKLLSIVKDIIDKGKKNGSKFYTEQILFSEVAKVPGTADLIEITKDGKYRIYDFKTLSSFYNSRYGREKNDAELYIYKGYVNQILIYSTILEEYGLEPAEDHLNILAIEINKNELELGNLNSELSITDVKFRNINTKDRAFTNTIIRSKNKILNRFKSPDKLNDFNIEDENINLERLILKLQRAVEDFKRQKVDLVDPNRIINHLDKEIKEAMGKQNKLIILSYIENIKEALTNVYSASTKKESELDTAYLRDLNFLIQMSSFLPNIETFLLNQSEEFHIESFDRDQLLEMLQETEKISNQVIKFQDHKVKEMAVQILSTNSNFMEGLWAEKFEMEARNSGKKSKEEIQKFVYEKLKKEAPLIEQAERQYWTSIFNNGYTDIRYLEWLLSDPGMNKSQFVQVVKNVMDKADMDIRIDLDNEIADLINWYDNLKIPKTGDPKKVWGKFLEKVKFKDKDGNIVEYTNASIIPETTSEAREVAIKYDNHIKYYERLLIKANKENNTKKSDELKEFIKKVRDEKTNQVKKASIKEYIHPSFEKLNEQEKEVVKFIHKKLEDSDLRLINNSSARLVKVAGGQRIYNLPKQRKSHIESVYESKNMLNRFTSGLMDFIRPPADEDDINWTNNESSEKHEEFKTNNTDIEGNPLYEVPVYYRRELEDPELQSFDIPTLLALNDQTTIQYEHFSNIEPDLFMITESLKNTTAHKTDSVVQKKVVDRLKGGLEKSLNSEGNRVLSAVKSSIDNRLYKRTYKGIYSKGNYRLIKSAEALNKVTGMILLAGNFGSASMTSIQGSIYRFVEGIAGEDFSTKDVAIGSKKAWADIHNVIADSQKQFPSSLTNLLIRRFGLDTQYKALVNKFVQDNFVTKNLDEGSIFALTSIAETLVTSSLMYTLMNNIKVMNDKGDFIDSNGKVVPKKDAMSLDEAYTVEDNKLVLNKHVAYTEFNLTERFRDNLSGEKTNAATEISRYIRSKYADLYGQYNQDMKSVAEMHVVGKLAFSMKKWIPRGYHRRWRGLPSVLNTFEEMKLDENLEKRFYSQDQKKFQEGYYTTGLRYIYSLYKEFHKKKLAFGVAHKNVKNTMNTHERANLVRLASEMGILATSIAAALLMRVVASKLDDDDDEKDAVYFAAYLAKRIEVESATFINPFELINNVQNPAASINTITRLGKFLKNLVGFTYDADAGEWDFEINNEYEKGPRKGEYKIWRNIEHLIPFYKKTSQFKGILGLDSDESIEDSYKYLIR